MTDQKAAAPDARAAGGPLAGGAGPFRRMAVWLALCLALVPAAFGQSGSFDWSTVPLLNAGYPGIKRAYVAVTSPRNMKINCLQIDTTVPGLRFYTTPAGSPPEVISQTTRQFITASRSGSRKLVAAVNAGPWSPYNPAEWNTPKSQNLLGLAVSEGALVSPGEAYPSFLADTLGAASMARTYADQNITGIRTAVSGFDFVLSGGNTIGGGTDLHPRTGIGLSQDSRYVYLMTIDGRQTASAGATTEEVGAYLKYFGSHTGINMDGGGSTTMAWWNPGTSSSQLLNVPVGNPYLNTGERYNANNLGLYFALSYSTAWWTGGSGAWTQSGAWQTAPSGGTAMTPTAAHGLAFAQATASPQAVTLGADRAAQAVSVSTTDAVSLTGGGANRTLTLGPGDPAEPLTLFLGASAGPFTIGSSGAGQQVAVALQGAQTWMNISASPLTLLNTVSRAASETADRDLTLTGSGPTVLGAVADGGASGRLGLVKSGAGRVTLTGTSSYSGTTTITGGRLAASALADNTLSPQSVINLSGGALDIAGRSQTIAGLTGTGGEVYSYSGQENPLLAEATLRLEGNTPLAYDAGSGRNVWANTGAGGSAYDAKDRAPYDTNGAVTQETYTLSDGASTAKRMVFNGLGSGFDSALKRNQSQNLTAYAVVARTDGSSAPNSTYQNLWSFDWGYGGWSRGMGFTEGDLVVQTKTGNTFSTGLGYANGTSRVVGASFAGSDPQTIHAYANGATIPAPLNPYGAAANTDSTLAIGYLYMYGQPDFLGQFFNGRISALMIWDRLLDAGERQQVEAYLNSVYVTGVPAASASATLTLDVAGGQTCTYGGRLGSDQALLAGFRLAKSGGGTQILTGGSNNFVGGTTLHAGVLRLDHANAAGPGPITQTANTSTLQVNAAGTVANAMSLQNISILQSATLSGAKTLPGNATYTVAAGATATESGSLGGAGGLSKQGAGELVIAGGGSYAGNTEVAQGTVRLAPSGSMRFAVGTPGVNNAVGGAGAFVAEGAFEIELGFAGTAPGNSWQLVAAASKSFGGTFSVAGFTESPAGTWIRRANGTDYVFSEATGSLSVDPYLAWTVGYGLDPATNGAWGANPDGDALPNSAEYAFGSNPVQSNGATTQIAAAAGQIVISWPQRTDGSVTYTVEESPDLSPGSWGVSSATVQAGNPSPAAPTGYERKQITVPATENMRFFRIAAAFMP